MHTSKANKRKINIYILVCILYYIRLNCSVILNGYSKTKKKIPGKFVCFERLILTHLWRGIVCFFQSGHFSLSLGIHYYHLFELFTLQYVFQWVNSDKFSFNDNAPKVYSLFVTVNSVVYLNKNILFIEMEFIYLFRINFRDWFLLDKIREFINDFLVFNFRSQYFFARVSFTISRHFSIFVMCTVSFILPDLKHNGQ